MCIRDSFHYFHSKPELLAACFYHVDRQVDAQLKQVDIKLFSLRRNIRELWFLYFGYFASHGDHAKFYSQFRHSSFYTRDVMRGQTESFAFFNHFVELNKSAILIRSEVFWEFVIDTTLNLAVNVADGKFPDSPKAVSYTHLIVLRLIHVNHRMVDDCQIQLISTGFFQQHMRMIGQDIDLKIRIIFFEPLDYFRQNFNSGRRDAQQMCIRDRP